MHINYLILIHKSPRQVKRLIESLLDNHTSFFLHIDKKIDITPFKEQLIDFANVFFVPDDKRIAGQWGGFELVEATLNTIAIIPNFSQKSYNILLSGQDYPVKSPAYIHTLLSDNYGTEYIDVFTVPSKPWWPSPYGLGRIDKYLFRKSPSRYDFVLFPSLLEKEFYNAFYIKELGKLIIRGHFSFLKKLLRKRTFPTYLMPYGGHQWWALTAETMQLIMSFLNQHPDYIEYHRDSLVPDEFFFQSIIKCILPTDTPIKACLTYANWTRKNEVLPVTFTTEDLYEIKAQQSNFLYARKFDIDLGEQVLNLIDQQLRY
ncbi:beta-1,6-N-acetylglucosaminyltransferase [Mucilaginibacter sp. HD30]